MDSETVPGPLGPRFQDIRKTAVARRGMKSRAPKTGNSGRSLTGYLDCGCGNRMRGKKEGIADEEA